MSPERYPSEAPYEVVASDLDRFIDAVFDTLQSSFLLLPEGPGFVPYTEFAQAYEVLKLQTRGFSRMESSRVMEAIRRDALSFVVLRTILGFSPPELAYVATERTGHQIPQGYARAIDREVREDRRLLESCTSLMCERIAAMVAAACRLIDEGGGGSPEGMVHRLDKADTRQGLETVQHLADQGVPYAMLLYERLLGRPFASHRDSVSGIVGEVMENAVEAQLRKRRVSFRRTQRAETIEGFDQVPDFMVPDEWNPRVVIEAKSAEDDGTARDKVTRIQHLATISRDRQGEGLDPIQVVACVDGRGFGVRREDMRKLLEATQGKVFTLETIEQLVEHTDLQAYASAPPSATKRDGEPG
jgi:hypothetical protein